MSCWFDSSHWIETPLFRWTPPCFRSKSFFRFSMLSFRLRPLFHSSPALFVRLLSFVCNLSLSMDSSLLSFEVPSFVSLCSSFVSGLSSVQVLSCSFDSSHSFLSFVGLLLTFVRRPLFRLYALLSLEASLSFKSCLGRSTPLIRLQPLSFVGLLLTFVRSPSFVSLCSFFV